MSAFTLYGIPSCDSCRKAQAALKAAGHSVVFRDIRAEPLADDTRAAFLQAFGDALINRASTTWRALDAATRAQAPEALLAQYPTLMKRPVIRGEGGALWLGWSAKVQEAVLAPKAMP